MRSQDLLPSRLAVNFHVLLQLPCSISLSIFKYKPMFNPLKPSPVASQSCFPLLGTRVGVAVSSSIAGWAGLAIPEHYSGISGNFWFLCTQDLSKTIGSCLNSGLAYSDLMDTVMKVTICLRFPILELQDVATKALTSIGKCW